VATAVISEAIAMIVVLLGLHRFFFSGWSSVTVRSSQDGRSFGGHHGSVSEIEHPQEALTRYRPALFKLWSAAVSNWCSLEPCFPEPEPPGRRAALSSAPSPQESEPRPASSLVEVRIYHVHPIWCSGRGSLGNASHASTRATPQQPDDQFPGTLQQDRY
jgi:hypothetical protein